MVTKQRTVLSLPFIQYQTNFTSNGPSFDNVINLVEPRFYSGWVRVDGWWPVEDTQPLPPEIGYFKNKMATIIDNLETFADKGRCSGPESTRSTSVGVTALEFLKKWYFIESISKLNVCYWL